MKDNFLYLAIGGLLSYIKQSGDIGNVPAETKTAWLALI